MFCKARRDEAISQTTVTIYILTMQMRQNKDFAQGNVGQTNSFRAVSNKSEMDGE